MSKSFLLINVLRFENLLMKSNVLILYDTNAAKTKSCT